MLFSRLLRKYITIRLRTMSHCLNRSNHSVTYSVSLRESPWLICLFNFFNFCLLSLKTHPPSLNLRFKATPFREGNQKPLPFAICLISPGGFKCYFFIHSPGFLISLLNNIQVMSKILIPWSLPGAIFTRILSIQSTKNCASSALALTGLSFTEI